MKKNLKQKQTGDIENCRELALPVPIKTMLEQYGTGNACSLHNWRRI